MAARRAGLRGTRWKLCASSAAMTGSTSAKCTMSAAPIPTISRIAEAGPTASASAMSAIHGDRSSRARVEPGCGSHEERLEQLVGPRKRRGEHKSCPDENPADDVVLVEGCPHSSARRARRTLELCAIVREEME
eukprot:scaffold115381_cov31-Tisochrysis_lutea.AAC.1